MRSIAAERGLGVQLISVCPSRCDGVGLLGFVNSRGQVFLQQDLQAVVGTRSKTNANCSCASVPL